MGHAELKKNFFPHFSNESETKQDLDRPQRGSAKPEGALWGFSTL